MRSVLMWVTVVSLVVIGVSVGVASGLQQALDAGLFAPGRLLSPYFVPMFRACVIVGQMAGLLASFAGAVYLVLLDRHVRRIGGAGFNVLPAVDA